MEGKILAGVAAALFGSSTCLFAQPSLVGTYKGEYWEPATEAYPNRQQVVLEIKSVTDGKVTGQYTLASEYCRGTYEVEGILSDNELALKTRGPKKDCGQELMLRVQDDKLTGNTSAAARGRPGLTLKRQ